VKIIYPQFKEGEYIIMPIENKFDHGPLKDIDPGVYQVRIISITDTEMEFQGVRKPGLEWIFEFQSGKHIGSPMMQKTTKNLGPKATLFKWLSNLLGKAFNPNDDAQVVRQLNALEGTTCMIQIALNQKGWPTIGAIFQMPHPGILEQSIAAGAPIAADSNQSTEDINKIIGGDDVAF
jgi:hypothetical protein